MKFLQLQYQNIFKLSFLLRVLRLVSLFVFFLFFSLWAFGQEVPINGKVVDENGNPLKGNTYISYLTKKVVAQAGTGTFRLYIDGSSENFNKDLLEASRAKYAMKSVEFNKETKQLTIFMIDAKENAGVLLDEKDNFVAGANIIFSVGNYKEKVISSSNGGKFTIHIPKHIEVANGSFNVNGILLEAKDIKIVPQGSGINRITLIYRLPQKASEEVINTKLASPKGISAYTFRLEGQKNITPVANLKFTVEGKTYKTDAEGKATLSQAVKANVNPTLLDEYVVTNNMPTDETAIIYVKKTDIKEIVKTADPYRASFSTIKDELSRTKDLIKLKNERIKEEIEKTEKRLTEDANLKPEQRKQFTETLESLKKTLAKNEVVYNQVEEESEEVLTRMEIIISSKQDSLQLLKDLAQLLEEKNQKIEEERALEAAEFRNKILLAVLIALLFAGAAVYLFILSKRLNTQKKELTTTLAQVKEQKAQIEAQNVLLQTQKEEIERKNIRLEDLDREKNSLMNIVAHDLKAPLNKIAGAAQLLPNLGDLNEEQNEFAQMIKKVAFEGKKFIEDLLDINAIEQQKPEAVNWEKIQLESFINKSIIGYRQQAEGKKIQLHFLPQLNATEIDTDRSYLNRIIDNLVSNAIKFSPQEKNIYISATENPQQVSISIKDEGPGISPEDQKKMFKKFQKLSARPTAGESSTGLGLSIIKTLVERLHGEISVSSELGKGTEFTVVLPKEKLA